MSKMKQGERYSCEKCDCVLEVIQPCTCQDVQELVCTCGTPMRVLSTKAS